MILITDTIDDPRPSEPVSYADDLQAFIALTVETAGGKAELHEIVDACFKEFFGLVTVTDIEEAAKVVKAGWDGKRETRLAAEAASRGEVRLP